LSGSSLGLLHIHPADQPVAQPIDVNNLTLTQELPARRAHNLADEDGQTAVGSLDYRERLNVWVDKAR
jgi:hypothetical protein